MKTFCFSFLILLFGLPSFAQDSRFETGLELGPNGSRIWGNESVERFMERRIGFAGVPFFK